MDLLMGPSALGASTPVVMAGVIAICFTLVWIANRRQVSQQSRHNNHTPSRSRPSHLVRGAQGGRMVLRSGRRKKRLPRRHKSTSIFKGIGFTGSKRVSLRACLLNDGSLRLYCSGRPSRMVAILAVLNDDAITRAFIESFELTDVRLRRPER
jgi:hypothetical protein